MSPQHFYKTKVNVLFLGPSGCGKTLLHVAMRSRGLAGDLDVPMWHQYGSTVKGDPAMYRGSTGLIRSLPVMLLSADCIVVRITPQGNPQGMQPPLEISVVHGDHRFDFQMCFEDVADRMAAADRILAEFPEMRTGKVADNPAMS